MTFTPPPCYALNKERKNMKIFKKIALAFALVLAVCLPAVLMAACGEQDKLSIVQTFKTEYMVGEELDVSGGIIKYIDEEGNAKHVELQESMISVFSTEKPGNKTMMITYENETLAVKYVVKPWDVQNNVYYSDATPGQEEKPVLLFLSFNKAQNKVTMFNALSTNEPDLVPENEKQTFQMTKDYDEDGNIVYRFVVSIQQGDSPSTNVTYTISNITKNSLKMSVPGAELTLTIYES